MAMIKCSECGNDVSDKAPTCPNCGAKPKKKMGKLGYILLALTFIGLFNALSSGGSGTVVDHSADTPLIAPPPTPYEQAMAALELKTNWRQGGFGAVMVADFTIKNGSKFAVRDIDIACEVSGNSGTKLGEVEKTVYEEIKAGGRKTVHDLSMGFINSQATRAGCYIKGFSLVN